MFSFLADMCPLDHFYALYVPRAIIESIKLKTKIELQVIDLVLIVLIVLIALLLYIAD